MLKLGWIISAVLAMLIIYLVMDDALSNKEFKLKSVKTESQYVTYYLEYKGKPIVMSFGDNGNIRHFGNFIGNSVQNFDFHNNGILAVKTMVDSLDRVQNGRYYFFESNGNLSHLYNYFNNNKVGVARSYFPDAAYAFRELMEYDSLGRMYYRRTFDKMGNTIKIEGEE